MDHRAETSTPPPVRRSPNPLKRKDPPDEREHRDSPTNPPNGIPPNLPQGEYATGRVICEVCGSGVSFRDEDTGGFTLKHWDAHRTTCVAPGPTPGEPVIYTPESTAEALANPPAKRRRAKRTEEERIEYLRADPYVAQFEAYRVLCASCDKWIRLRPNSTYCSIPWDAHRKSCLSKKISSKNVYALEERNSLFAKDPDVRKFDAERVLCNMCDRWLSINPDDHLQAVQKWLQHRSSCQRLASGVQTGHSPVLPPSEQRQPELASGSFAHHTHPSTPLSPSSKHSPKLVVATSSSSRPQPPSHVPRPHHSQTPHPQTPHRSSHPHPDSPSSFHDLNPANFAPAHESRRRNAEQRAATLRSDVLIGQVEANRVFCSLCQKWVQLRQDSSYCAYPWLQHRGKCLARHQRRAQKAAEVAEMKARRVVPHEEDELMSDDGGDEEDPESEEGVDSSAEAERARRKEGKQVERKKARGSFSTKVGKGRSISQHSHSHSHHGRSGTSGTRRSYEDGDADGDMDAEGDSYVEDGGTPPNRSAPRGAMRRPWPIGLADLDSHSGRKNFIFASVDYLFTTTYESSDDMTISALLTYLNAAMPQDKHEDFDTSEVIKAAAALQEKGRIVFEGDMLRLVE